MGLVLQPYLRDFHLHYFWFAHVGVRSHIISHKSAQQMFSHHHIGKRKSRQVPEFVAGIISMREIEF